MNTNDRLKFLMDVSVKLTSEKDADKLFELITSSAMELSGADGGMLYTLENHSTLLPRVMIIKSSGFTASGSIDTNMIPTIKMSLENICAAAAITKKLINVEDIYEDRSFDFSAQIEDDKLTGYHTQSCMVVPMENISGEVIGVLKLTNAIGHGGEVIDFGIQEEKLVEAIASLAGISLSNIRYSRSITSLLDGFVRGISTGIDSRTPYNANHTRNMVAYANAFMDFERRTLGPFAMEENERIELNMSIWLHDIGKLATPLEVMDKAMRLTEEHLTNLENRYGRRELLLHLAEAKGELSREAFEKALSDLKEEHDFIMEVNKAGFLPDEKMVKVEMLSFGTYKELNGEEVPNILPEEMYELMIRKGTLTAEERHVMQDHVVVTNKILSMLNFPKNFSHVPIWAGQHHEFLDGSGYPNKLDASNISWPSRLITILDIFEALTAADRPYRRSMSVEQAFNILDSMVAEGKLDGNILEEYKKSGAWEETMRMRQLETVNRENK